MTIDNNFFSPNPVFDDGQVAPFFCIRKAMADELLTYVASQDLWFQECSNKHKRLREAIIAQYE
jgi:hypothetical protein